MFLFFFNYFFLILNEKSTDISHFKHPIIIAIEIKGDSGDVSQATRHTEGGYYHLDVCQATGSVHIKTY